MAYSSTTNGYYGDETLQSTANENWALHNEGNEEEPPDINDLYTTDTTPLTTAAVTAKSRKEKRGK